MHSNRGYEVGIVYMDDFNRATTALVSPNNTIRIPCSASVTQNKIKLTIPIAQLAPSFATRYKFVIKPTKSTYETIYSERYYDDPTSTSFFFFLFLFAISALNGVCFEDSVLFRADLSMSIFLI